MVNRIRTWWHVTSHCHQLSAEELLQLRDLLELLYQECGCVGNGWLRACPIHAAESLVGRVELEDALDRARRAVGRLKGEDDG